MSASADKLPAPLCRVLVIDSNASLLRMVDATLRAHHYAVVTAEGPREGLRVARKSGETYAVIISSLRFHYEFLSLDYLKQLYAARAGAAIIVISGALPDATETLWLAEHRIPFLPKPFQLPDLLCLIAQCLPASMTPPPLAATRHGHHSH
jgi:DNA-binding NtrC family response regulator